MISCFPKAYPDELLYSQLARYYVRSGHLSLTYAIEELYVHKYTAPDIEFINELNSEVVSLLTQDMSMQLIIQEHTMFPSYARFLPKDRREQAMETLIHMHGNFNNILAIPKNQRGVGRCLRYCPVCAKYDRLELGEAYWHRVHQIDGIEVCYLHGCKLSNTDISMNRKAAPSLVSAEIVIPYEEQLLQGNEIERRLAEYMVTVFDQEVDMNSYVSVGEFLHYRIDSKYKSDTGVSTKLVKLYNDYCEYYAEINTMTVSQMQKVFNGYRYNFRDVCQLAMFEKIPAEELAVIPISSEDMGRDSIYESVAQELNLSFQLVKSIGDAVLKRQQNHGRVQRKCGAKTHAWRQIDMELLPQVKESIRRIYGEGDKRPRRVTIAAVCREMRLPDKRFDNLPMCKAEIVKNMESQKEYWAREVVWAYNKLMAEGIQISWKQIRNLTNMRNVDFQNCKPYLQQYADSNTAFNISNLI